MDLGLRGRRALVLGSSSGLGRAVAAGLVAEGARVAVVSRDLARAEGARAEIGAELALDADLTVEGQAAGLVDRSVEAFGGLDVVIVNTGGGTPGPLLDTEGADDAAYRSMLRPVLEVARAAAPHVVEDDGRLIFLTARSVVEATPELALSSVFRSGVNAAARSLAVELAPRATSNVVVTGQFATGALERFEASLVAREGRSADEVRREHERSNPMGRLGTPEEFADVVVFLASARSSFVNGASIRIDGGAVKGF